MQKVAEVFLLAGNRLLREALIRLLTKRNELRIVGATFYSPLVHHEIIAAHPKIIILDSSIVRPSKTAVITTLRTAIQNARVVLVDMDSDEGTFLAAIRAGVTGYVLKDASASEVAETICAVAAGKAVCPPSLCMTLFRCIAHQVPVAQTSTLATDFGLSRRELEIVELLRERLTNKEIASRLSLSEQTVKNHVHHSLRKIGAPNRFSIASLGSPLFGGPA